MSRLLSHTAYRNEKENDISTNYARCSAFILALRLMGLKIEPHGRSWMFIESHGKSWNLMKGSVSVTKYDLEVSRNF